MFGLEMKLEEKEDERIRAMFIESIRTDFAQRVLDGRRQLSGLRTLPQGETFVDQLNLFVEIRRQRGEHLRCELNHRHEPSVSSLARTYLLQGQDHHLDRGRCFGLLD